VQPVRTLTIKNLPGTVHRRLAARAAEHGRSLNSEVIACLKAAVMAERLDPEALLDRARALRREMKGRISDIGLRRAKNRGRP
jgi:plasmid stability protein